MTVSNHSGRFAFFAVLALAAVPGALSNAAAAAEPEVSWERDIRPILKSRCFHCHGEGEKPEANLDLRLVKLIRTGGDSGAALVDGKPADSLLLERVRSGEMPPKDKKLSVEEVAKLERWIAAGAPTLRPEPADPSAAVITDDERSFWAFQPLKKSPLPAVANTERVRNPIDAYLLARLESKNLSYSPEADRPTLIRRLSFSLLGLPPAPADVDAFVNDPAPDAYERLVDRLLASPHYGERWARHWLDVAGYADSEGYTDDDPVRAEAWKYRDYVIRAFNDDKPFSAFVIEQLAGDELVPPPYGNLTPDQLELLTATGFLRMAPDGTGSGGVDQPVARNQVVADTLQIVSSSLLGLTVACAQCHNHRYDPIPQTDYYRFRAIFEPALNVAAWRPPAARRISLMTDEERARSTAIEAEAQKVMAEREKVLAEYIEQTFERELAKLPEEKREPIQKARNTPVKERTPEQVQLLKEHPSVNVTAGSLYLYDRKAADDLKKRADEAQKIRETKPVEQFLRVLNEVPGQIPETKFFYRGDHQQPRQSLPPGELSVLDPRGDGGLPNKDSARPTTGRRLAYAQRLVSGSHPLVARVFVNRVWMHHFGRGIVASPADFGLLGERPTHPELLDWLAAEFSQPASGATGWSVKQLHRLMVTSAAYRQSSRRTSELDAIDPDNHLLGRMSVRRLEAEIVRDATLAVNGTMTPKLFGAPVPVMQDEVGQIVVGIENLNGENRPGTIIPLHGEEYRRSVYVQVRRSRPLGVLESFDSPVMTPNCEFRPSSTVATQSLMLMNSEFVREAADQFASHVVKQAGTDPVQQVVLAWKLAYGETPAAAETEESVAFLKAGAERFRAQAADSKAAGGKPMTMMADADVQSLSVFCQALLSSNRFLYVD